MTTADRDRRIRALWRQNLPAWVIAQTLEMSTAGVTLIARRLGLPKRNMALVRTPPVLGDQAGARPRPVPRTWRCACGQIHHQTDRHRCPAPWEQIDARLAAECRQLRVGGGR